MTAFAVQVELALLVAVEIDAPLNELLNLFRGILDNKFDRLGVAQPIAGHHGVVYMFFEIIYFEVGDTRNAALRQVGVGFLKFTLANQRNFARMSYFECKTHAGNARADDEKIILPLHNLWDN